MYRLRSLENRKVYTQWSLTAVNDILWIWPELRIVQQRQLYLLRKGHRIGIWFRIAKLQEEHLFWFDDTMHPILWRVWSPTLPLQGLSIQLKSWKKMQSSAPWGTHSWTFRRSFGIFHLDFDVQSVQKTLDFFQLYDALYHHLLSSHRVPVPQASPIRIPIVHTFLHGLVWSWMGGGLLLLCVWVGSLYFVGKRSFMGESIAFPCVTAHPFCYAHILPRTFPSSLCRDLIDAAEAMGWMLKRHTQPTQDRPLSDLPGTLRMRWKDWFEHQMKAQISQLYEVEQEHIGIREAFVVKYDTVHRSALEIHRDASILTMSIALQGRREFEGGGTFFPLLDRTIVLQNTGDILLHCGKLQHGGRSVLRGVRYVLVVFLDLSDSPLFAHEDIDMWDSATPSDMEVLASLVVPHSARNTP